ncbi:polyketide synthase [Colletotrichum higginsianum]|nr:polyketide synthase [Colletotrichum higginsianum]
MAIEAARQVADPGKTIRGFRLRDISIGSAVFVNEDKATEVVIHLRPHLTGTAGPASSSTTWCEFTISTSEGSDMPIRENCHGLVCTDYHKTGDDEHMDNELKAALDADLAEYNDASEESSGFLNVDKFYQDLNGVGLGFGPAFRNVTRLRVGTAQSVFEVTIGDPGETFSSGQPGRHHLIHPTTLDSIFCPTFAALYKGLQPMDKPIIPTFIEELSISCEIPDVVGTKLKGFAKAKLRGFGETTADIRVFDEFLTSSYMTIRGFRCTSEISGESHAEGNSDKQKASELCFDVVWEHVIDLMEPHEIQRAVESAGGADCDKRLVKMCHMFIHSNPESTVLELLPSVGDARVAAQTSIASALRIDRTKQIKYGVAHASQLSDVENGILVDLATIAKEPPSQVGLFDLIIIPQRCRGIPHLTDSIDYLQPLLKPSGKLVGCIDAGRPPRMNFRGVGRRWNPHLSIPGPGTGLTVFSGPLVNGFPRPKTREFLVLEPTSLSARGVRFAIKLTNALSEYGMSVRRAKLSPKLLAGIEGKDCVSLLELDHSYLVDLSAEDFETVRIIALKTASVTWITGFSDPTSSIVSGLFRSIRNEAPGQQLRTVHCSLEASANEELAGAVARILHSETRETEFLFEDGLLQVGKLRQNTVLNSRISSQLDEDTRMIPLKDVENPVKLVIGSPGLLDTLYFTDHLKMSLPLDDDEVEIRVEATGSTIRTRDFLCATLPDSTSFEAGAALPVVCTTAYHAIVNLARLRRGQSILIHAASGGVGQAAIQLAQHLGVVVYATVSSREKRKLITEQYGLPDDRIFYSRDASFALAVKRVTNGRGVDCVLNSLAGELLRESFYCLAPLGIMVEIGSRDAMDNTRLDMRPFSRGATFTCFTLLDLLKEAPDVLAQATQTAFALVRKKVFRSPYPLTVFPVSKVRDAFRLMQSGKHLGKLVLSFKDDVEVPVNRRLQSTLKLDPQSTFLLIGGLGGLGRSLARLLVDSGARNLAFISRSQILSSEARALVTELTRRGANIRAYSADIARNATLLQALDKCRQEMPPIRGCSKWPWSFATLRSRP